MATPGTDNGAVMDGYTRQFMASNGMGEERHISVRPNAPMDYTFRAFDHDNQEYIVIKGWLWSFEPIEEE